MYESNATTSPVLVVSCKQRGMIMVNVHNILSAKDNSVKATFVALKQVSKWPGMHKGY